MSAARRLRLPRDIEEQLRRWGAQARPAEACGLLVGRSTAEETQVVRATLAPNVRAGEGGDRYEVDPAHHLAVWKQAEREGLEVVGAWHSHPGHPAVPSETDRLEAWEGLSYVIVAVDGDGPGEVRSWRLVGGAFAQEEIGR